TNVDVPLPASARRPRYKRSFWAGVGLLVVAGAFAALRPHFDAASASATSMATTLIKGTPTMATASATVEMTMPVPVVVDIPGKPTSPEVDGLDAKTPPAASAAPKSRSRKSRAPSNGHSPAGTSQEIDVGF